MSEQKPMSKQKPSVRKSFRVPSNVVGLNSMIGGKLIKMNGELVAVSHTMDVGIKEYTLVTYTIPEFEFEELKEDGY